jgi:hypothetical protein
MAEGKRKQQSKLLLSKLGFGEQLIYRAWLKRESLPRDNRSHAPDEVRSKCLDLSRICLAAYVQVCWFLAQSTKN